MELRDKRRPGLMNPHRSPSVPLPTHHFTVDVEEYFQVLALEPYVSRGEWDRIPQRVDIGVHKLLDLLDRHRATATFFVLGWVADRSPTLIKEIAARGHEIASHGYGHERVTTLKPKQFRESVRDSKRILEDSTGRLVLGYRAPNFSIVRGAEWALEILVEEGYRYDSSLFPGRRGGYHGGRRDPYCLQLTAGCLHEFPPATLRVGSIVVPAAGGAYLRHLPYAVVEGAVRAAERRGVPATIYVHPWELDPSQPVIRTSLPTRLRHYGGLARTAPRVERLLRDFSFQSIGRSLRADPMGRSMMAAPAPTP